MSYKVIRENNNVKKKKKGGGWGEGNFTHSLDSLSHLSLHLGYWLWAWAISCAKSCCQWWRKRPSPGSVVRNAPANLHECLTTSRCCSLQWHLRPKQPLPQQGCELSHVSQGHECPVLPLLREQQCLCTARSTQAPLGGSFLHSKSLLRLYQSITTGREYPQGLLVAQGQGQFQQDCPMESMEERVKKLRWLGESTRKYSYILSWFC